MRNGKDSIPDNRFGNAIVYFIAPMILKLLDILTTTKFLQMGIKEANPLMAWLMMIDVNLAFMVSFFMGLTSFGILYYLKYRVPKITCLNEKWKCFFNSLFNMQYSLMIGIGVYVVIHNLLTIQYVDSHILI